MPPPPIPSHPPHRESEDHDRFSTSALCHELLHPIALPCWGQRLSRGSFFRYRSRLGLLRNPVVRVSHSGHRSLGFTVRCFFHKALHVTVSSGTPARCQSVPLPTQNKRMRSRTVSAMVSGVGGLAIR